MSVCSVRVLCESEKTSGMDAEQSAPREGRASFVGGCEGRDTGHIPFHSLSGGALLF